MNGEKAANRAGRSCPEERPGQAGRAAFYQLLKARGIRLVEGDAQEFAASNGLSLNVLPTSPHQVIAVAGFPKTAAAMEAAGCSVQTFEADALCIACEGGPTCLTRPFLRA